MSISLEQIASILGRNRLIGISGRCRPRLRELISRRQAHLDISRDEDYLRHLGENRFEQDLLTEVLNYGEACLSSGETADQDTARTASREKLQDENKELRNSARQLSAERRQFKETDRRKTEFLSAMSHQLRAPLNNILALCQIMLAKGTGRDPAKENAYLEIIERSGLQMLELVNGLLDLSKIESGYLEVYATTCDPRHCVETALETVRATAEQKQLELVTRLAGPEKIVTDVHKLTQILTNLLSNAVKFTDSGTISIELGADRDQATFTIHDTGVGMTPQELEDIFSKYKQLGRPGKFRQGGSGLGLVIAKKLAELIGGRLTVVSKPGEGSSFHLEVPQRISPYTITQTTTAHGESA